MTRSSPLFPPSHASASQSAAEPATQAGDAAPPRPFAMPPGYWQLYGISPGGPIQRRSCDGADGGGAEAVPKAVADATADGGGQPLPAPVRTEMESKLGADLSSVRVHTDASADAACAAVQAEAFTKGSHIYFRRGKFDPTSSAGKELLAHELTHVVQQGAAGSGGAAHRPQRSTGISDDSDPAEAEARAVGAGVAAGRAVAIRGHAPAIIHRATQIEIVECSFLGQPIEGGINTVLKARLDQVKQHLTAAFQALPEDKKRKPGGGGLMTFLEWAGIREPHKGRNHGGPHASGSAIDVNHATSPYIATGTAGYVGGEGVNHNEPQGPADPPKNVPGYLKPAVKVYARASAFVCWKGGEYGGGGDVRWRREKTPARGQDPGNPAESTEALYDRLRRTSDDLAAYLQFAVRSGDPANRIQRPVVPDAEHAKPAKLLARIPTSERLPEAEAVALIRAYMDGAPSIARFDLTPEQQYIRILRDYELVRVPMEWDSKPSARPNATRNPANGFLDQRKEFVVAMCDPVVGNLRWGGGDFGQQSGDMMHFDLWPKDRPG